MTDRPPLRDYSASRAVLMGTWSYQHLEPLPAARHSLNRMTRLLTGELCGWPSGRVSVLRDQDGSGHLADRLITLFEDATDVALFYFVGHGQMAEADHGTELCLGMAGSRPEAHRRASTSVPFRVVRDALRHSPATTKIVILDCCYAGLATLPANTLAGPDLLDTVTVAGTYTMAASGADSTAWVETDTAKPQTYFTKTLADTVEAGVPGAGDALAIRTLFTRVRTRLAEEGRPLPIERNVNTAHDFAFAHNKAPSSPISEHSGEDLATEQVGYARRRVLLGAGAVALAAAVPSVLYLIRSPRALAGPPAPLAVLADSQHRLSSVAFSPDGSLVAAGTDDGGISLWPNPTSRSATPISPLRTLAPPDAMTPATLTVPAFSPSGRYVAVASSDQPRLLAAIWEVATGKLLDPTWSVLPPSASSNMVITGEIVAPWVVDPGWTRLAGFTQVRDRVGLTDFPARRIASSFTVPLTNGAGQADDAVFTPDGELLAVLFDQEYVAYLSASTGTPVTSPSAKHVSPYAELNKLLGFIGASGAAVLVNFAGGLFVLDRTSAFVGPLQTPYDAGVPFTTPSVARSVMSDNGMTLAATFDTQNQGIFIWDLGYWICALPPNMESGEPIQVNTIGKLTSMQLSPDGKTLYGGDSIGQGYLWDCTTGQQIAAVAIPGSTEPIQLAASRDGRRLAATSGNSVYVWDAADVRSSAQVARNGSPSRTPSAAHILQGVTVPQCMESELLPPPQDRCQSAPDYLNDKLSACP